MGADRAPVEAIDYETAKRLARDLDPNVRRELAGRAEIMPEILYYLASDVAAEVRATIAANPATPVQADLLLAGDDETAVLLPLVEKMAAKLPPNGAPDPGPLEAMTAEVLARLAAGPSVAVRRALAEAIQDLEHAPSSVVRALASDAAPEVAVPVLGRSPQLTEDDLAAFACRPASTATRAAIAGRTRVSARIADVIAGSDDAAAIATLLANHGAQIRETTLDHILERAPNEESWHRPLVYRPGLPGPAVRRLARFVAVSLVEALQHRPDLDPAVAAIVSEMLSARIEAGGAPLDPGMERLIDRTPATGAEAEPLDGAARARDLARSGLLDHDVVDQAVLDGDRPFVVAAVAALARTDETIVDRVFRTASAKGTIALAWRAGLGVGIALKLQSRMAHVPPRVLIHPRDGTEWPLTPEEMAWQLDFFGVEAD